MRSMSVKTSPIVVQLGERDRALVHAAEQRLADRLGLLADLLLHEARPAALLGGGRIPLHLERAGGHGVAGEVGDLDRVGADRDDLVLADLHRLLGVLDERGDVRAEEVLALAQPDHERRVAAGADDDAGTVLVHDEQGEGAVEARDHALHGEGQVAGLLEDLADHEGRDLGVGLARELGPGIQELLLQLGEVLDDAVVDERELAVVAEVRVRVAVGGAAVGRPAGVADAGVAVGQRLLAEVLRQDAELAGALARAHLAVVGEHGDAGRVVAPVFEPLQAAEEHVDRAVRADVTHDSTHGVDSRLGSL